METESLQTDDCFQERLVYSDSENSDADETIDPVPETSTKQMSDDDCSLTINKDSNETVNSDQNHLSNDSDEGDFNKSIKKVKKSARTLCSDDENDSDNHVNEPNQTKGMGNDSGSEDIHGNSTEPQARTIVRPSICDSDTNSSSDGIRSKAKSPPKKSLKKLKKKKKKSEPRKRVISNQSDSESNDEDADKPDKKQKKSAKRKQSSDRSGGSGSSGSGSGTGSGSGSGSGSASDSNSSAHNNETSNDSQVAKPREKVAQRVFVTNLILLNFENCDLI